MSLKSKSFLSGLAVLAAASAPAHAEEAAAEELVRTAQRTASSLTRCQAAADDLASQIALRVWSRHREVLGKAKLRQYVEACVRNAWRDQLRRGRRSSVFSELALEGEPTGDRLTPDGRLERIAVIEMTVST